jgi:hypothetical protein
VTETADADVAASPTAIMTTKIRLKRRPVGMHMAFSERFLDRWNRVIRASPKGGARLKLIKMLLG